MNFSLPKKKRATTPPYAAAAQDLAAKSSKTPTEILGQDDGNVNEAEVEIEENSIRADYANVDVEIANETYDEGQLWVFDAFYVTITPTKGTTLALALNRDQIQAIKEIFDHYLEAFEINRKLLKLYQVKARKKEVAESA